MQHLWNCMLQHFFASKLRVKPSIKSKTSQLFNMGNNENKLLPSQCLLLPGTPRCKRFCCEREGSVCGVFLKTVRLETTNSVHTCLPSLRHCEAGGLWSLPAVCWEGPSCRLGFSILRARRSLTMGRYTVPSWALHLRMRMDNGQPFSRDRTTPAWE